MVRQQDMADRPGEEWRWVPGYEGRYDVSSKGRVRSYALTSTSGRVKGQFATLSSRPVRVMTPRIASGHYHSVTFCVNGVSKSANVHRLVMAAFVGSCKPGHQVRHLDGNPLNNTLGNLAYGTVKDNMQDMVRHGRSNVGTKNPGAVLDDDDVRLIRMWRSVGHSQRSIADAFGVDQSTVSCVVRRIAWRNVA